MRPVELASEQFVHGTPHGEPWVFLHGFPLSRRLWDPQRPLVRNARVVLPDLRGHGESPMGPPGEPASMEAMAGDVLALCDRLGVERMNLVGLSMGGYVALALQARAPGRVERLVLADSQAGPDTPEAREGREQLARKVLEEGNDALLAAMMPKLLSPTAQRDLEIAEPVRAMILANPPEGMAAALRGMALRADHRPRLRSIACPTLALVGELDEVTPEAKAREMVAALPHGQLAVIPSAGHLSNLEAPEVFIAAIRGFLAGASPEMWHGPTT